MAIFPDYYVVIGVLPTASSNEIKRAFRRRALEIHPDVNPDPDATERFIELNEAFHVLGHPVRRSVYDSLRASSSAAYAPSTNYTPRVTVLSRREKLRIISSAMGFLLRRGVVWACISLIAFIGGMALFEAGLSGLAVDFVIIVFALLMAYVLFNEAISSIEIRGASDPFDIRAFDDVTARILVGTLAGFASILALIMSIIVVLDIYIPHLSERAMLAFPVMLSVSTIWVIVDTFSRSRATAIQLHRSSEQAR
jgi:curved DNA-binding protein CbpA